MMIMTIKSIITHEEGFTMTKVMIMITIIAHCYFIQTLPLSSFIVMGNQNTACNTHRIFKIIHNLLFILDGLQFQSCTHFYNSVNSGILSSHFCLITTRLILYTLTVELVPHDVTHTQAQEGVCTHTYTQRHTSHACAHTHTEIQLYVCECLVISHTFSNASVNAK